ncbi:MAG: hypothetical protein FJ271_26040 [Planctomycetes bacterium]|nr:hypothetical protein [Planctomycetota bacterium]
MNRRHAAWYFALGILALAPVGLRVLSWSRPEAEELDQAAVNAGKELFVHEWAPNDAIARANGGDGLGPVYNATSCFACHKQGGLGGAGGLEHNVTNFIVASAGRHAAQSVLRQGVVHTDAISPEFLETLTHVDHTLPRISRPTLASLLPPGALEGKGVRHQGRMFELIAKADAPVADAPVPLPDPVEGGQAQANPNQHFNIPEHVHLSQRNTPALFGARLIDEIPDRVIIAQERLERVRFGMAAPQSREVPVGRALRDASGKVGKFGWKGQSSSLLDFVQAACANELGLSNPAHAQPSSIARPEVKAVGLDLTNKQCRDMRDFIASLPQPIERNRDNPHVAEGRQLFTKVGCADCHTPSLGSVDGIYSDLLLHRMGDDLQGQGSYHGGSTPSIPDSPGNGPLADEWRTPPLWGIADSGPYLHDGRATTLKQAIEMHGGQAQASARRFGSLTPVQQIRLITFLESLRAPEVR